jgi:uncharacterized membrane protein YoaK (UPF0700 family)
MPSAYSPESRNNSSPYPENPFLTPQSSRHSSIMRSQEKITYTTKRSAKQVHRYFNHELRTPFTSIILIICFFTSGLIDSVAFNVFSCFVGMQTGNTVFAALGISGQPLSTHRQQYYKSLVSIGAFMLGTLFFNFIHRYPKPSHHSTSRRRSVFVASFAIQTVLVVIAAVLANLDLMSNRPAVVGSFSSGSGSSTADPHANFLDLVPIALLAFQASGQVCLTRVLEANELPTIVLSTLYHDFTADLLGIAAAWQQSGSIRGFFLDGQRRQGRRAASIVALFLGGIVGGEMFKSSAGMSGGLLLAAGIKGSICVAWVVWKGDDPENCNDSDDGFDDEISR